jgi:class 3 adenylate cyclase
MVTFLLTDVEASTRLWQQYRTQMGQALARHDELIEQLVTRHGGVLVRPRGEGDSRFAVFARASDAAAAACAIQIHLLREVWGMPDPIRVRVAIHTGEADVRKGDYYGPAINHCARLRSAAHGGQVLVSEVTAELVRESLSGDLGLRDLGWYQLGKGLCPLESSG